VAIFSVRIVPDLVDDRVQTAAAPSDCTKLLRVVALLIDNVHLIEYLSRLLQTDTVLSFDFMVLPSVELEAHFV